MPSPFPQPFLREQICPRTPAQPTRCSIQLQAANVPSPQESINGFFLPLPSPVAFAPWPACQEDVVLPQAWLP